MPVIEIDASRIHDWESFHDVSAEALGFPPYYGRNLDAWIDCVDSLAREDGAVLTLLISHGAAFRACCPEQYAALIECSAFVNWRRAVADEPSVVALAFE